MSYHNNTNISVAKISVADIGANAESPGYRAYAMLRHDYTTLYPRQRRLA